MARPSSLSNAIGSTTSPSCQFGIQVAGFAVKTHCDDILVFREELDASLICCHLLRFAVECNGDGLFSHELSFAIGVRGTNVQAWTVCQR